MNHFSRLPPAKTQRARVAALLLALCGWAIAGCVAPHKPQVSQLPSNFEIRSAKLVIRSDFELSEDDPRVVELHNLRREVRETLQLPPLTRPVVVYLFQNEDRYTHYMRAAHPELPSRRAFFIGTPGELAVYAFWGEQVREDLRHEYTHGLLHASLGQVPLWLDEGLAEYFEVVSEDPERINQDHAAGLATMLANGWEPDLHRMEQLTDVSEMQRADYQEAWAWTHFLLREGGAGRDVLLDYLAGIKPTGTPPSLADRLTSDFPGADERFAAYLMNFATDTGRAGVALGQR